MKNNYFFSASFNCLVYFMLLFSTNALKAQCVNADFSDGNFTGWTGTHFNTCTDAFLSTCICSATNPFYSTGFNQGPDNTPPYDSSAEFSQVITTAAAGSDSNLLRLGVNLPVVWPGGSGYAARIGNMWQSLTAGGNGDGDGESMSYTFVVTPGNCNFTYHYAVVLDDGGHAELEQPYFKVKVVDGSNNEITCAEYNVDATTCHAIGGFVNLIDPTYGNINYKPWSSVLVPLENYIGQTVTISFITRGCLPSGCAGSHYCYAYFSCECAGYSPLRLAVNPGNHCGSPGPSITAPAGFGTYSWTGPGVLGLGNTQTIYINQPGHYSVAMTTEGSTPCTYGLDTVISDSLNFLIANFSASTGCLDSTVVFTDLSGIHDSITSWAWDFNNDGITDSIDENPTYKFPGVGTYPVKLTITSATCTTDTVINITVVKQPTITLLAPGVPVCAGVYDTILYAVSDSNTYGLIFNWNFDSANVAYALGDTAYQLAWYTAGTKTVTLTVIDSNCASLPASVQVFMKPFPQLGLPWDTGICAGNSIILSASGATSYAWAANSTLSDTTAATVIATPDTTTTYTVTGTLNGCSTNQWVTVQVSSLPVFSQIGGVTDSVCVNDTLLLGVTCNAPSGAVYTWSFDGGLGYSDTPTVNGQLVIWPTAGTKTVTVSVNNAGCVASDTTIVYVSSPPALTLIGDTAGCIGNQITLTATGASAYVWAVDTLLYTSDSITLSPDTTLANIYVTGTTNGCSTIDAIAISGYAVPVATFITSGQVCTGDTLTVTFTGSAVAGATFNWNFGNGNANTLTGPGPILVSWDSAGFSPVSLTVSQYGCSSTFADTVPVQLCNGIRSIASNQINIYPNPAKNEFTVEVTGAMNKGNLEICDVLGQVLYREEISNESTGFSKQMHLDVAAGVYFVTINDGDKHYTQRLVIE